MSEYNGPQGKIAARRPRRVGRPGATAEHAGWGAWKMGKWAEKGSSGDSPEERGGL